MTTKLHLQLFAGEEAAVPPVAESAAVQTGEQPLAEAISTESTPDAAPAPENSTSPLQQKAIDHLGELQRQAAELKSRYPALDLRQELKDPRFLRMTSPSVGLSVEDAYWAIHRKELQAAAMQAAAQGAARSISGSIRAMQRRPDENGSLSQGASISRFDYRSASREQREALKSRIRAMAARGEKLYPGQ